MTADRHAWDRGTLGWDVYYTVVFAATLLIVIVDRYGRAERAIAAGALAAMAVWYLAVGRAALRRDGNSRQGTVYLACLVGLLAIAQSQVAASSFMLFAVCPQCFMAVPLRRAVIAATVTNLAPVGFLLDHSRLRPADAATAIGIAAAGLSFSVMFARWIGGIVQQSAERADLIGQLQATRAELAQANHEAGTHAERQRLAGEIHDTLAQGFTTIVMLIQAAEAEIERDAGEARRHLGLAARTARENLEEARAMVAALPPAHLASGTLDDALHRLTNGIGDELGVRAGFEFHGSPRPLPAGVEVVLLRAAQEALANVRKHADARHVSVRLRYDEGTVRLDVVDDGVGFEPGSVNGGYGLRGMRGRVTQVGGSLDVRSLPAAGTTVSVEVPA